MFFIRTVVMTLFLVAYAQGYCLKSHQLETGEMSKIVEIYGTIFQKSNTTYAATETTSTVKIDTVPQPQINYRLPKHLKPSNYRLTIQHYFNSTIMPENYTGLVEIDFECVKATDKLVIHVGEIVLNTSSLTVIGKDEDLDFSVTPKFETFYDPVTQFFTVAFAASGKNFKEGKRYTFTVNFLGFTKENRRGFYRSNYNDNGVKWFVGSYHSPTYARNSFPCFDEPEWKAKFSIKVIHDNSLNLFSNMPIKSSKKVNLNNLQNFDWTETEFDETPVMPTYNVAIVLADFKCINKSVTGMDKVIDTRVCARPNVFNQLDFVSETSVQVLIELEKNFGVSYPLPKLDHVTLSTAMEGWGLAGYPERYFLTNQNTTQLTESLIYEAIGHITGHQWVGNLVTMKWWDDHWLEYGLVYNVMSSVIDRIKPTEKSFQKYFTYYMNIIYLDAGQTVPAMSRDLNTPQEIELYLSSVAMSKGQHIVRMLQYILGQKSFDKAVTQFLTDFKYQSADQYDFFNLLVKQGKQDGIRNLETVNFTAAMVQWARQPGHPVISVRLVGDMLKLKQNRFFLDSSLQPGNQRWTIPITYSFERIDSSNSSENNNASKDNLYNKIQWFNSSEEEMIIQLNKTPDISNDFFLLNLEAMGFFRVNYELENWQKIIKQLDTNPQKIKDEMKSALIRDSSDLFIAGYLEADLMLRLSRFLAGNTDIAPCWAIFIDRFGIYEINLKTTRLWPVMEDKISELIRSLYLSLNLNAVELTNPNEPNQQIWKTNAVRLACRVGLSECVNEARKRFETWITSPTSTEAYLIELMTEYTPIFMCTAIKWGDKSDFFAVYNKFGMTNITADFRFRLMRALSCAMDLNLQKIFLHKAKELSTNTFLNALNQLATNSNGYDLSWQLLKSEWQFLYQNASLGNLVIILRTITRNFNTVYQYNDFSEFFKINEFKKIESEVLMIKIEIEKNIGWINKNFKSIENFLNE